MGDFAREGVPPSLLRLALCLKIRPASAASAAMGGSFSFAGEIAREGVPPITAEADSLFKDPAAVPIGGDLLASVASAAMQGLLRG